MELAHDSMQFGRSVEENIRLGRPGASRDEIVEAAKAANAHDFISKFDGGYEYRVGTRGSKVSGGQKQRIARVKMHAFLCADQLSMHSTTHPITYR